MSYLHKLPPRANSTLSQCELVKKHLLAGHTLTSFEAYRLFNITCLAQRVHDLRNRYGFEVITTNVKHNGKRFAVYSCDPRAFRAVTTPAPNASAPVEGGNHE